VTHSGSLVPFAWVLAEIFVEFVGLADEGVGVRRRRLLSRDVGPSLRILAVDVEPTIKARLGVGLDGVDRAFRLADPTVDALVGMNDEHVLALVEAVHRTDFDAIGVFALDANFSDDVGHLPHTESGCAVRRFGHFGPPKTDGGPCLSQSGGKHKARRRSRPPILRHQP